MCYQRATRALKKEGEMRGKQRRFYGNRQEHSACVLSHTVQAYRHKSNLVHNGR